MMFNQGDVIFFNLDPSVGHEPAGRRPALVVSSFEFNVSTSMTLVCPITSTMNEFPLHLALPETADTDGCVACEQVRAYDMDARNAERIESLPNDFMKKVTSCIKSFF